MYQRLSGYAHAQHMPIGDGIVIAEGPLYRDQMLALACVAKHFGVPHELMFGCGGTHCLGERVSCSVGPLPAASHQLA
jgi:hypothetical protein